MVDGPSLVPDLHIVCAHCLTDLRFEIARNLGPMDRASHPSGLSVGYLPTLDTCKQGFQLFVPGVFKQAYGIEDL